MARTKRWLQANSGPVYIAFMVLTGALVTAPFALILFLSPEVSLRQVYDRFPADQTPWIYRFESNMPGYIYAIAIILLFTIFYPSIGYLNAIFARTRSIAHAIGAGIVTSLILVVLFGTMLGWVPLAGEVSDEASPAVKALGNVVWTPEGMTQEEALEKANSLYKGLEAIPVEERAEVVAKRVQGDQFAEALETIGDLVTICFVLAVPVIVGTVVAHVLLQRDNWLLVRFVRYCIASGAIVVAIVFSFFFLWRGGHGPEINGKPLHESPGIALLIIGMSCVIAFLCLRRWRRQPVHNVAT